MLRHCKKLFKKSIILLLCFSLAGCVSLPSVKLLAQETKNKASEERVFNYTYEEVFYASEDAMQNIGSPSSLFIRESNLDEGYILATKGSGNSILWGSFMIVVEKIDEEKTSVKIRVFRNVGMDYIFKAFFKETERILARK